MCSADSECCSGECSNDACTAVGQPIDGTYEYSSCEPVDASCPLQSLPGVPPFNHSTAGVRDVTACSEPRFGGVPCTALAEVPQLSCTAMVLCKPVDGWWSEWSDCSAACGEGSQARVWNAPVAGGVSTAFGSGASTRPCTGEQCCKGKGRGMTGTSCDPKAALETCCSGVCDSKTKKCLELNTCVPEAVGYKKVVSAGQKCKAGKEMCCSGLCIDKTCQALPKPVDGVYKWSNECDTTGVVCPRNDQNNTVIVHGGQTGICVPPTGGGAPCSGPYTRDCTHICAPVAGRWTDWSECDASCGGLPGTQSRTWIAPVDGGSDAGYDAPATQPCASAPCNPVDGFWSPWTKCSVSCGGGTQVRAWNPPKHGGSEVGANDPSVRECNSQSCKPKCLGTGTLSAGQACNKNEPLECCSGVCDSKRKVCLEGCVANTVGYKKVVSAGQKCKDGKERCCSGICQNKKCAALNPLPQMVGEAYSMERTPRTSEAADGSKSSAVASSNHSTVSGLVAAILGGGRLCRYDCRCS